MLWTPVLALLQEVQQQVGLAPSFQWIPVVAALLGGGAMGAIITTSVNYYRNRRQPIGYTMETVEVFKTKPELQSLKAVLMVGESTYGPGSNYPVDNFSIARLSLVNKGNQDITEYKFGVTLKGTNKALDVSSQPPDRHHNVKLMTPPNLVNPTTELDFTLQPFNRKDKYDFNIYFTYDDSAAAIELSSPHATTFTEMIDKRELYPELWRLTLVTLIILSSVILSLFIVRFSR